MKVTDFGCALEDNEDYLCIWVNLHRMFNKNNNCNINRTFAIAPTTELNTFSASSGATRGSIVSSTNPALSIAVAAFAEISDCLKFSTSAAACVIAVLMATESC